jgi:hypothetical protein
LTQLPQQPVAIDRRLPPLTLGRPSPIDRALHDLD